MKDELSTTATEKPTYSNIPTEKMREILSSLGFQLRDEGKEWRCLAFYRDSSNDRGLRINKTTGKWQDFGDGSWGNFFDLIKKVKGVKGNGAKEIIENLEKELAENPNAHIAPLEKISYVKFFNPELLKKLKPDHRYWLKRGVKQETIELFQGGLCYSGNMIGRYVFPIFDEQKLIRGFSGRSIFPEPEEKNKRFIKWKHFGDRCSWEYPLFLTREYIEKEGWVIVVESIGDMLRLWDNGVRNTVVSFGLGGLDNLIYKLVELDPKDIIIGFNDDTIDGKTKGSGNREAVKFARRLVYGRFFEREQVRIVRPTRNDFGAMSDEEITQWTKKVQKKLFI